MTLPDLKELDKLIALCRKRGIKTVKVGDLELTLDEAPVSKPRGKAAQKPSYGSQEEFKTEGVPSEEDLLFWSASAGGLPMSMGGTDES